MAYCGSNFIGNIEQPWFVLNALEPMVQYIPSTQGIVHVYRFIADTISHSTLAIPDGCVDIMLDCSSDTMEGKICGSTLSPQNAGLKHGHDYLGIRFSPGTLLNSMDISAKNLIGHTYDAMDMARSQTDLFEQLFLSPSFNAQIALIERYFSGMDLKHPSEKTQAAIACIFQYKGNIQVAQIEEQTNISKRTLQRLFMEELGLSPKSFSRIVRCQSAINEINRQSDVAFIDLALELGFSDQPHFLREFKSLVNSTPYNYRKTLAKQGYSSRIQVV